MNRVMEETVTRQSMADALSRAESHSSFLRRSMMQQPGIVDAMAQGNVEEAIAHARAAGAA